MTQVSVERLFSAMKFILSDLRTNLNHDILDDILIVRTNKAFMKKKSKKNSFDPNKNKKRRIDDSASTLTEGMSTCSSHTELINCE